MRTLQKIRARSLERHVHRVPYAALVLSGHYEEAGDRGRFEVTAGNVIFHDQFEAHRNRFYEKSAIVLNLRLPSGSFGGAGIAGVDDPDRVARLAETDRRAAAELLLSMARRWKPPLLDWPDELAASLMQCSSQKLRDWGEQNGVVPWKISRGFSQVFGISPEAFRARIRAQRALWSIQSTRATLSSIAAAHGFADQAHMTRAIKDLTGMPPQAWRSAANGFKTMMRPGI